MAHYLIRLSDVDISEQYQMVEADSAKQAVEGLDLEEASVVVWTLRSGSGRVFTVSTESVRTITQT